MAKYPFRVVFADALQTYEHVVWSNDRVKAVSRARAEHLETYKQEAPEDVCRFMNLEPKQVNGEFLPRIDGTLVSTEPFASRQEAVDAALKFLRERAVRS